MVSKQKLIPIKWCYGWLHSILKKVTQKTSLPGNCRFSYLLEKEHDRLKNIAFLGDIC